MVEILLASIPLLALLASLLFGHYPGHAAAMRLGERIAARGRREMGASALFVPRLLGPRPARGGLLLALGLSGRAPPE
jgi:hypothetical protein